MSALGPQPDEIERAEPAGRESVAGETYRSLLRLAVGLALVGGSDLFARLREWEAAHPGELAAAGAREGAEPMPAGELASRVLIGLTFEAVNVAGELMARSVEVTTSVAGAMRMAFRPLTASFLFRPLRASARSMAARGETNLERILQTGALEKRRSRWLAADVTGPLLEDIVRYAGENPGVKALVDDQVNRLLPALVAEPTIQELLVQQLGEYLDGLTTRPETLDPLVRKLGDRYIAYLNEHPDDVQNLVQGQAAGMATEVRDQVRTMTVTGDTLLEMFARGLLRRKPREELPLPKAQLGSRNGSTPSDAVGWEDEAI